jgi:dihydroorotase
VKNILIKNATIVNEGKIFISDVLIRGERIEKIAASIAHPSADIINAGGLHLFPGIIDDQVHFREPGLTHKGDIHSESRSAVAGGVTSFMEMPNTIPNVLTQELLEEKYAIGSEKSFANFSFYMGVSNDNADEVLKTDKKNVCGIKIFMGSSTGNMLVDRETTLRKIFSESEMLIATHCEDEKIIRENAEKARKKYGENVPVEMHPVIRSAEACYASSSVAVELAKSYGTRLHVLHISTAKEISLFRNDIPLAEKKITSEACIHHLWFDDSGYERLGNFIKWNPAVKTAADRDAVWNALLDDHIDVIATDHAPHTKDEKSQSYFKAPSGGPLIQHSLVAMLEFYHNGKISLQKIVSKMAHDVAECFRITERGYLREGYFADMTLVNLNSPWKVSESNILAKCKWSPFEGQSFQSKVEYTFVNGVPVYSPKGINESSRGQRLKFLR